MFFLNLSKIHRKNTRRICRRKPTRIKKNEKQQKDHLEQFHEFQVRYYINWLNTRKKKWRILLDELQKYIFKIPKKVLNTFGETPLGIIEGKKYIRKIKENAKTNYWRNFRRIYKSKPWRNCLRNTRSKITEGTARCIPEKSQEKCLKCLLEKSQILYTNLGAMWKSSEIFPGNFSNFWNNGVIP